MGKAILEAARPPMWEIERSVARAGAGAFVRFGHKRIALSQIAGLSLEEVRNRQAMGLFVAATAFVFAASVFAYFVFEQGAMARFLIGTFFLGGLGVAGLIEASRLRAVRHYELTITLVGGERLVFASADRTDIQALALRLAAELGQAG